MPINMLPANFTRCGAILMSRLPSIQNLLLLVLATFRIHKSIGHGYQKSGSIVKASSENLTWHFLAKNVLDFAWTADPDYTHDIQQVPNGPTLHFFYQKNDKTAVTWKNMEPVAVKVFQHLNEHFGKYPFDTYSVIQGGDGGMEYPYVYAHCW
jgi:hypothetical protein